MTGKESLAEAQHKIIELRWRLGLVSDADYADAAEFYQNVRYEADR